MGKSLQRWNAHDAVAQALVDAGVISDAVRRCANAHASLLGLQTRFDVALLSTKAKGEEPYLVYELRRGAAIGLYPLGSAGWLIQRALFTLTSGQRFSRWIWMNAELFERESAARCLPVGIMRRGSHRTLPVLDQTARRRPRVGSPKDNGQLSIPLGC